MNMIKVRAPIRIDLSGGTLDLSPLNHFVYPETFATINLAISIYNDVEIMKIDSTKILIFSSDLELNFDFGNLDMLLKEIKLENNPLQMILKAIYYFEVQGIQIKLSSQVPKGSGLGNSSSLLIAVLGALNLLTNKKYSNNQLIRIAQGIETSILKIPTGSQDYISALYGGLNRIEYHLLGYDVSQMKHIFLNQKLQEMALLCYVEEPMRFTKPIRNPNWDIFKKSVEQPEKMLNKLLQINDVVITMYKSIKDQNWSRFITCINEETEIRSQLSDMVVSAKMEETMKVLKEMKVDGFKICGAGGGGCILIFTNSKKSIISEMIELNNRILDFSIDINGMQSL